MDGTRARVCDAVYRSTRRFGTNTVFGTIDRARRLENIAITVITETGFVFVSTLAGSIRLARTRTSARWNTVLTTVFNFALNVSRV